MPTTPFRLYDKPEDTLRSWARTLNYLFNNLDSDNLAAYDSSNISVSDTGGFFAATDAEGTMQELGQNVNYTEVAASTMTRYGLSQFSNSSGAGSTSRVLAAPAVGANKILLCTYANSTDTVTVSLPAGAAYGYGIGSAYEGTVITFTGAPQAVHLIGVSTARWAVTNVWGTPTFS